MLIMLASPAEVSLTFPAWACQVPLDTCSQTITGIATDSAQKSPCSKPVKAVLREWLSAGTPRATEARWVVFVDNGARTMENMKGWTSICRKQNARRCHRAFHQEVTGALTVTS